MIPTGGIRPVSRHGTAARRSVVIDLTSLRAEPRRSRVIEGADVVMENLRPGSMERLGLSLDALRTWQPGLVTCSISAYGSSGPRDDPGWEPLVHARAGAQQGLFTGDQPIWLPFPMASVAAALLAVLGVGAALVKREIHRLRTTRRDVFVRSVVLPQRRGDLSPTSPSTAGVPRIALADLAHLAKQ